MSNRTNMNEAGDALRHTEIQSAEQAVVTNCRESFSMDELRAIALHMGVQNSGEIVAREILMDKIRRLLSDDDEAAGADETPLS